MNLPVGNVLKEGVNLKDVKFSNIISTLMKEHFTGYIVLTVEGYSGIEEGLILFRKGIIIGSIFDYSKFQVTVYGGSALEQSFNSSNVHFGVFDICALSTQQVDLVTAFNEKIKLEITVTAKNLNKLIPNKYEVKYAKKVLADALKREETKFDVFRKLGLSGINQ
ncbi:MAG: DUF2226 domain-containing protein [Candidatus Diapherotrites archaeon]